MFHCDELYIFRAIYINNNIYIVLPFYLKFFYKINIRVTTKNIIIYYIFLFN
jgi:hypothetical protein